MWNRFREVFWKEQWSPLSGVCHQEFRCGHSCVALSSSGVPLRSQLCRIVFRRGFRCGHSCVASSFIGGSAAVTVVSHRLSSGVPLQSHLCRIVFHQGIRCSHGCVTL